MALHDLGLASGNLCLEATARGFCAHMMAGISPEKAQTTFRIPDTHLPANALAIGYPGDSENLDDSLKQREQAPRTRKRLSEFVFTGFWENTAEFLK